jgi:hypothetical protein
VSIMCFDISIGESLCCVSIRIALFKFVCQSQQLYISDECL